MTNRIVSLVKQKTSPFYDFDKQIFNNCTFNVRLCPVGAFGYRPAGHKRAGTFKDRKRVEVSAFTRASRFRLQKRVRELEARLRVFARLSYPAIYPSDGRIVKRHWATFVKRLFRYMDVTKRDDGKYYARDGRLFSVLWFFEFQDRGAPHFHFLCTHYIPKGWLANAWYEIVGSGDENHFKYGTRIEKFDGDRRKLAWYAGKYAAKSEQKVIPESFKNSGRFWGVAGNNSIAADTLCFDAFDEDDKDMKLTVLVKMTEECLDSNDVFREVRNQDGEIVGYWINIGDTDRQELMVQRIIETCFYAKENLLQAEPLRT